MENLPADGVTAFLVSRVTVLASTALTLLDASECSPSIAFLPSTNSYRRCEFIVGSTTTVLQRCTLIAVAQPASIVCD